MLAAAIAGATGTAGTTPTIPRSPLQSKGPYICSLCGHISNAVSSYRYHMMRHSGRFPHHCPYCGQGAPSTTDVKKHLMRHHTGRNGCHCIRCGEDLIRLQPLREHLKLCQGTGVQQQGQTTSQGARVQQGQTITRETGGEITDNRITDTQVDS